MGALSSLATVGLDLANSQQKAKEDKSTAAAQATDQALQIQKLTAQADEQNRQTQADLARRLAAQRARAGASGVSSTGGSIDAVLDGLSDAANADEQATNSDLQSRLAALQNSYSVKRRSLLDNNNRFLDAGTKVLASLAGSRRSLLD